MFYRRFCLVVFLVCSIAVASVARSADDELPQHGDAAVAALAKVIESLTESIGKLHEEIRDLRQENQELREEIRESKDRELKREVLVQTGLDVLEESDPLQQKLESLRRDRRDKFEVVVEVELILVGLGESKDERDQLKRKDLEQRLDALRAEFDAVDAQYVFLKQKLAEFESDDE